jgi:spore germination cell wall hydrolase CwlJ-like protein
MKIVHGPQTLRRLHPARGGHLWGWLLIAAVVLLIATALIALAIFLRGPDDAGNGASGADNRRALDMASFRKAPPGRNADAAAIVQQTALDKTSLEPLSASAAQAANARIAVAADVGPPALPLIVPIGDGAQYVRALFCMTTAIYYEAGNEAWEGQRAVAQVVINRSRHLAYPHSICGVVYQGADRATGCQFSFSCDGSLAHTPDRDRWARARSVAGAALGGLVYTPIGLATHYHADYVLPYWASSLVKQRVIGRHIFYRWPGGWGTRRAFTAAYDRNEPDISTMGRVTDADAAVDGADAFAASEPAAAIVDRAERPVLMDGSPAQTAVMADAGRSSANRAGPAPRARLADGRRYLMDRDIPPPPVPRPRGGVTGGVILPGPATGQNPAASAEMPTAPRN